MFSSHLRSPYSGERCAHTPHEDLALVVRLTLSRPGSRESWLCECHSTREMTARQRSLVNVANRSCSCTRRARNHNEPFTTRSLPIEYVLLFPSAMPMLPGCRIIAHPTTTSTSEAFLANISGAFPLSFVVPVCSQLCIDTFFTLAPSAPSSASTLSSGSPFTTLLTSSAQAFTTNDCGGKQYCTWHQYRCLGLSRGGAGAYL